MANLQIGDNGLGIIKKYEGCNLKAYQDSVGVWTIGYGHTSCVKSGQTITQYQAEEFLKKDCAVAEKSVNFYANKYNWNQNQFDALVSFTFNLGAGNLKKLLNGGERSISAIGKIMLLYNKAGGKVLAGLTKRREEEKKLFESSTVNVLKITSSVKSVQSWLNKYYAQTLYVDGKYGDKTKTSLLKAVQTEIGVKADGIIGNKTKEALSKSVLKTGYNGILVTLWQAILVCNKRDISIDGVFGTDTTKATKEYQESKLLTVDGKVGVKTWSKALS